MKNKNAEDGATEQWVDHLSTIQDVPSEIQTPDEHVQYAAERQRILSSRAIREIEYQLKYGDAKARRELALDLKKSVGLGENKQQAITAPIIVINQHELKNLPWLAKKKLQEDGALEDAVIIEDVKK